MWLVVKATLDSKGFLHNIKLCTKQYIINNNQKFAISPIQYFVRRWLYFWRVITMFPFSLFLAVLIYVHLIAIAMLEQVILYDRGLTKIGEVPVQLAPPSVLPVY